ncbi:hypothetical protein TNCV_971461 [Trichonephila clavipes]|nr:hypothetical protein TNCV_971461 [Trichonephila clavipes]
MRKVWWRYTLLRNSVGICIAPCSAAPKAAFTPRLSASSVERRANQRLLLARDEVFDWLDAQRLTLTALV